MAQEAKQTNEVNRSVQVLALTGGGFRGLYTAHVLERLERAAGRPIGSCFDLIAGTSIGGILALAVAFEVPMREVVRVFCEHGGQIFPPKPWYAGSFSSRHKAEALREVLALLLPKDATVGDAKHALAIPVLNLTHGKQQVVKTRHSAGWDRDTRYKVIDVALATAAAPIYLPVASMDNQLFADGGLFANAPDLIGLHEVDKFFGVDDQHVSMLSVGTLTETYALSARRRRNLGVADWLRPPTFPLIQTILAAQQQFSIQMVKHRLQDRYVRIDSQPHGTAMSDVGLDKADAKAQQVLLGFASKDVGDVIGSEQIKNFLQHNPARWIKEG